MKRLACLVMVAACGPKPAPPTVGNTTPTPTSTDGDLAFRKLATDLGVQIEAEVGAWGTAPIADDGAPHRFAVLRSNGKSNYGGYLVEVAPGQDWLVAFSDDGRTSAWQADAYVVGGAPPKWTPVADKAITHQQGWHGGYEKLDFDFEGGRPIVLHEEHLDDVREDDQAVATDYTGKHEPLAAMTGDAQLFVIAGPAATADALAKPVAQAAQ